MKRRDSLHFVPISVLIIVAFVLVGCATRQGYQGAGVGALTGATAGVLLDPENEWRGAVIGGGLGATLGGALTDRAYYREPYYGTAYSPGSPYQPSYSSQMGQGIFVGGLTGATAGALLDDDNEWRGGLIGGALGSFFGGSIGAINSGRRIPLLNP
jgi:hypothetical protein